MLDARVVAANMYQRNALTLRELQSIQSLRDRPVEAAETLLNIITEQPDAVYLCFLDVLKRTEQQHIYQRLVQDGYKGSNSSSSNSCSSSYSRSCSSCCLLDTSLRDIAHFTRRPRNRALDGGSDHPQEGALWGEHLPDSCIVLQAACCMEVRPGL